MDPISIGLSAAGVLGGLFSSNNAAKKAAAAQREATAEAKRQFDYVQGQNAPFVAAKTKAVQDISELASKSYNPAVVAKQLATDYGRANAAAGMTAQRELGGRGLAGGAIGAQMRSKQGGTEAKMKAKKSAADVFLGLLNSTLGENAIGTAMQGAQALSAVAQNQANATAQAASAADANLQSILGPLGSLAAEWSMKDEYTRLQQQVAALGGASVNGGAGTGSGGSSWNSLNPITSPA